eukprot:gene8621-13331_t
MAVLTAPHELPAGKGQTVVVGSGACDNAESPGCGGGGEVEAAEELARCGVDETEAVGALALVERGERLRIERDSDRFRVQTRRRLRLCGPANRTRAVLYDVYLVQVQTEEAQLRRQVAVSFASSTADLQSEFIDTLLDALRAAEQLRRGEVDDEEQDDRLHLGSTISLSADER